MTDKIHFTGEVQLMGYGESDSSGAWIKLQVNTEDLEHFRGLKGTTFDVTLGNPDQPIGQPSTPAPDKPKGGPLSKEAGKICHIAQFQEYVAFKLGEFGSVNDPSHELAFRYVRSACQVGSRAELDHNATAARSFRMLMADYAKYCEGCE